MCVSIRSFEQKNPAQSIVCVCGGGVYFWSYYPSRSAWKNALIQYPANRSRYGLQISQKLVTLDMDSPLMGEKKICSVINFMFEFKIAKKQKCLIVKRLGSCIKLQKNTFLFYSTKNEEIAFFEKWKKTENHVTPTFIGFIRKKKKSFFSYWNFKSSEWLGNFPKK